MSWFSHGVSAGGGAAAGGGTVDGSGSAGQVAFWSAGTTLDGHAGFTYDGAGKVSLTADALGEDSTDSAIGVVVENTTAAVDGSQQYSPMLVMSGAGWKTFVTAGSQSVRWGQQVVTVQGTSAPTSRFSFSTSINDGAWAEFIAFSSENGGQQILASTGSMSAPTYSFSSALGQDLGMYRSATNMIGYAVSGSLRYQMNSTFMTGFHSGSGAGGFKVDIGTRELDLLGGTADPTAASGIAADEGSIYMRSVADTGEAWVKTGSADAAWEQFGGAGAHTMQRAYDGGATITVVGATPIDMTLDGISTGTETGGGVDEDIAFILKNTTAVTGGLAENREYSPMLVLESQGWATSGDDAGTQEVQFALQVQPEAAATTADGYLVVRANVNNSSWSGSDVSYFRDNGDFHAYNQILGSEGGDATAPPFCFTNATATGMYLESGNGLGLTTVGTNALTIDSSQNSAFAGTASPASAGAHDLGSASVEWGTLYTQNVDIDQAVATSGTPAAMLIAAGGAHTTLTASAEAVDIDLNLARTVQFATGALTTQRGVYIQAPTYAFVGASTITTAATVAISGAPAAGTNATLTNSYALWVDSGNVRLDGDIHFVDARSPVNDCGEIYYEDTASFPTGVGQASVSSTPAKLTAFDTDKGVGSGVTEAAASDKITLDNAGKYLVSFTWSGRGSTSTQAVMFYVYYNGSAVVGGMHRQKVTSTTLPMNVSITCLVDATAAGNDIEVYVAVSSSTQTITTFNATLSVVGAATT